MSAVKDIVYDSVNPKNQFLRIYPPTFESTELESNSKYPVIFLVHGGFWRDRWNIDNALLINTVPDLTACGFAVCAIEYRRNGQGDNGGGIPGTLNDFVSSLCKLSELSKTSEFSYIDINKVTLMGHSAGGHAVLWLSSKLASKKLPFIPYRCVALAPVCDLGEAKTWLRDGDYPAADFIAGSSRSYDCDTNSVDSEQQLLTQVSPLHMLPLEVPTVLVSAAGDEDVPAEHVRKYYEKAQLSTTATSSSCSAGVNVKLIELQEGAHHYNMIEPSSAPWAVVLKELCES